MLTKTMAKTELLYPKNIGAYVAKEYSAPRTIGKIKILWEVLELPAKGAFIYDVRFLGR